MLCCAAPTLLYILVQALAYTVWGGRLATESSFIFTKIFEVWELYTENVALSVLMGMGFPLVVLLINVKFFLKDDLGRLGLSSYGIGVLEAAILGESGAGFEHGNFLWPMMSGMLVMWLVALLRLLALDEMQSDTKVKRILINVAWFVFALHFFYGLIFLKNMQL